MDNSSDSLEDDNQAQEENYFNTHTNNINNINTMYNPAVDTNQNLSLNSTNILNSQSKEGVIINYEKYYKEYIRDPGIEGRKASRLLFLRSFNNWVKATLIGKICYSKGRNLHVFDICCGRGGDLEKYFRSKVRLYVGADLSEESLKNAMDRIVKIKSEKFKDLQCKCFFIIEDVSDPDGNLLRKIPNEFLFDIVSCQFAMHYHFESEIRVRTFIENVVSKLNDGGSFIGTIIDSNVLVKRLRHRKYKGNKYLNEKLTFGNDFYSVKFYQKRFDKTKGPYGIKYGFYLEDSIDKKDEHGNIKYVGEYLVIFEIFVKLCEEYGLYLVEKKNFTDFYQEQMDNDYYRNLFNKMINEINIETKEQQWEIIQLYQIFVFRKGKPTNRHYVQAGRIAKVEFKDNNSVLIEDKFD